MEEWKSQTVIDLYNICDYVRIVTDNNIFICLYDEPAVNKVAALIYQKYSKPVYAITDNILNMHRVAARLIKFSHIYTLYRII